MFLDRVNYQFFTNLSKNHNLQGQKTFDIRQRKLSHVKGAISINISRLVFFDASQE